VAGAEGLPQRKEPAEAAAAGLRRLQARPLHPLHLVEVAAALASAVQDRRVYRS